MIRGGSAAGDGVWCCRGPCDSAFGCSCHEGLEQGVSKRGEERRKGGRRKEGERGKEEKREEGKEGRMEEGREEGRN